MLPDKSQAEDQNSSFSEIQEKLITTHKARESALKICRDVIQFSSRSIRALHRGEIANARTIIDEARKLVNALKFNMDNHPEVYYAGYIHDAQKEYVEAEVLYSIVIQSSLPSFSDLDVLPSAYLNGMAEAASETRRYILDRLRSADFIRAEGALGIMDTIYDELINFDFPDAITGGLRRTTDSLRAVLERTRADLTITAAQQRLEAALNNSQLHIYASNNDIF